MRRKLIGLGLCSGIGRLEAALGEWVKFIAHCEREPYPTGVLLQSTGTPVWDDLLTFPWNTFKGRVDLVCAGFPCQDVSAAGTGIGLDGERSVLVFEIIKGCVEVGAQWIFLENVPRVVGKMGKEIIAKLTEAGYDARWCCIRVPLSSPVGEGERFFLLAKANGKRLEGLHKKSGGVYMQPTQASLPPFEWETEPEVDRVVTRMRWRVDRIKALGNCVVKDQARQAFQILIGKELKGE